MNYIALKVSDIWFIIKKQIIWILLCSVIFGLLGFLISKVAITPTYEASTVVLVSQKRSNGDQILSNQQADIQIINTYKNIITNPVVIRKTVNRINQQETKKNKWTVDGLTKAVKIKTEQNSQTFSISVKSHDSKQSAATANTLTNLFKSKVRQLMKNNNVHVVSYARVPKKAIYPKYKLNIVVGVLVGFLGSLIFFMIKEQNDGNIIHEDYMEKKFGIKKIGELHIR